MKTRITERPRCRPHGSPDAEPLRKRSSPSAVKEPIDRIVAEARVLISPRSSRFAEEGRA